MRKVAIICAEMTKFGNLPDKTLTDLILGPSISVINKSGIDERNLDGIYVSNMLGGELVNQTSLGSVLADQLGLFSVAADRIENGPAAGASAVKNAFLAIATGLYDMILVAGGEKMRGSSTKTLTNIISSMLHPVERASGASLPSLGAILAKLYMVKYGINGEDLALISIKNHDNALKNPFAHLQKKITLKDILYGEDALKNNPIVSDPLRRYDIAPISDGGAALLLADLNTAKKYTEKPITIEGFGQAVDSVALHEREDPTTLNAVKGAAKNALEMANIKLSDINVAELHDAFTILELAESEDVGFFDKGTAHKAIENGETKIGGRIPINTSGGLKARGHPLGATGLAQLTELTWQLKGEAGERQVKEAKYGLSVNLGGFGSNAVSFVLKGGE